MGIGTNTSVLSRSATLFLQANQHLADALPDDGEPRLRKDFPDAVQEQFDRCYEMGIVERHHVDEEPDWGSRRFYWRVHPDVAAFANDLVRDGTRTPCGMTGISTVEPGTYTCPDSDCDCRFGRDRAKEVLG